MLITTRLRSMLLPALLSAGCFASVGESVESDLERAFSQYTLVYVDSEANALLAATGKLELPLTTGTITFQLAAHELRSPRYQSAVTTSAGMRPGESSDVRTYKGTIAGDPSTQVRLSADSRGIAGTFAFGGARYFVEPARKYSAAAEDNALVVYRAGASRDAHDLTCDHLDHLVQGSAARFAPDVAAAAGRRVIELATDADAELVALAGGAAQANTEILAIMNMVEGVYAEELGLTFEIVYQHAWTTPDPYSNASAAALLDSFAGHWESAVPTSQVPRDVAHLFSASPAVASAGLAKLDVVCRVPQASYGLSGYVDDRSVRVLIAAHELGHNIGANHRDGDACGNTVMNAQLSFDTPFTFCAASRADITSAVASHGACLAPRETPMPTGARTRYDFDGDGRADVAVFRPGDGSWYVAEAGAFAALRFGQSGDRPVAADYDGDGLTDHAVYRSGVWYRWLSATASWDAVSFGLASDVPMPGDYDGDGHADVAIYRPELGQWWVLRSTDGGHYAVTWGAPGDVPVGGDFDGDGRADHVVFRPSDGMWHRLSAVTLLTQSLQHGQPGDHPIAGDFDGDRRADAAVWRPGDGRWYVQHSSDASVMSTQLGGSGDVPVAADYDGDGRTDMAVYRPSTSEWLASTGLPVQAFGAAGDVPVPAAP